MVAAAPVWAYVRQRTHPLLLPDHPGTRARAGGWPQAGGDTSALRTPAGGYDPRGERKTLFPTNWGVCGDSIRGPHLRRRVCLLRPASLATHPASVGHTACGKRERWGEKRSAGWL